MKHEEIDQVFQEANKVLHMDASHSALRDRLQEHISAEHRKANASGDASSYYNTPYVRDVYGDGETGTVIHSKDGKLTASKFKKQGDGSYALSNHKPVKQAYVSDNDADDKKESLTLILDGNEIEVHEAATALTEIGDVVELQEAAKGTATAKVTLISAGKGSSGYYTENALKKAAQNKVFKEGTQMFLNHQTQEERRLRPEGDITKLAGVLTGPAEYVEGQGSNPGRLVAPCKVFGPYKDFLAEAKDDIGVSVRVGAAPSGKTQEGVPLVENMVYALSADFVTKAGRGGKIEEMYESFRATHPVGIHNEGGNQPQENEMTDQEKKDFAALQTTVSRLQESLATSEARAIVSESLASSGLKPRGQDRVRTMVLANVPLKDDGALDTAKLQESIKATIQGEIAYLQESGVAPAPVVRVQGIVPDKNEKGEELDEAAVAAASEKVLQESVNALRNGGK